MQSAKKQKVQDTVLLSMQDDIAATPHAVPATSPAMLNELPDNKISVVISLDREHYTSLDARMAFGCVRVECAEETIETAQFAPWDLVLCVDDSGSMEPRLRIEKIVIEYLIRAFAGKPGRLGLVSFSSSSTVHIPLQSVTVENVEALVLTMQNALTADGCTNLGAGISMALKELRPSNLPSRARGVILISDGQPTEGELDSSRIQKLVQDDPNATGTMFSALAIGPGCDTKLLSNLCHAACGGSLFEISGDANPARELGAMVGLGFYQRLVEPMLVLRAIGVEPPHDACGLRHIRSTENGTLTYFLGNMSVGDHRSILFHVDLTGGVGSVNATLVGKHAIGGAIVSAVAAVQACSITANASSAQDASLALQVGTIHAIDVICGGNAEQFQNTRKDLLSLIEQHGPLANDRDKERAHRVVRRLAWCIEMRFNPSGLEQLRRTTTTDLVSQRSTTMQATQNALAGLRVDSELEIPEYEPISCPLLARAISQEAEQFTQEAEQFDQESEIY